MNHAIAIAACRVFKREIESIARIEEWNRVKFFSFPAECHTFRKADCAFHCEAPGLDGYDPISIHVFHTVCMARSRSEKPSCRKCIHHFEETCFYMLAEKDLVDGYLREGAYLLTQGWLHGWRNRLKGWGMDRNTAAQFFGETTRKLVLLDTLGDPASIGHLAGLSEYVGLPSEVVPVGLRFFSGYLRKACGTRNG